MPIEVKVNSKTLIICTIFFLTAGVLDNYNLVLNVTHVLRFSDNKCQKIYYISI